MFNNWKYGVFCFLFVINFVNSFAYFTGNIGRSFRQPENVRNVPKVQNNQHRVPIGGRVEPDRFGISDKNRQRKSSNQKKHQKVAVWSISRRNKLQFPQITCPRIFRYEEDEDGWNGHVTLKRDFNKVEHVLEVIMCVNKNVLNEDNIKLSFLRRNETHLHFKVQIPDQTLLPKLISLKLNGEKLCRAHPDPISRGGVRTWLKATIKAKRRIDFGDGKSSHKQVKKCSKNVGKSMGRAKKRNINKIDGYTEKYKQGYYEGRYYEDGRSNYDYGGRYYDYGNNYNDKEAIYDKNNQQFEGYIGDYEGNYYEESDYGEHGRNSNYDKYEETNGGGEENIGEDQESIVNFVGAHQDFKAGKENSYGEVDENEERNEENEETDDENKEIDQDYDEPKRVVNITEADNLKNEKDHNVKVEHEKTNVVSETDETVGQNPKPSKGDDDVDSVKGEKVEERGDKNSQKKEKGGDTKQEIGKEGDTEINKKIGKKIDQKIDKKTDQKTDQKADQKTGPKADQKADQRTIQKRDQKIHQKADQKTDQETDQNTDQKRDQKINKKVDEEIGKVTNEKTKRGIQPETDNKTAENDKKNEVEEKVMDDENGGNDNEKGNETHDEKDNKKDENPSTDNRNEGVEDGDGGESSDDENEKERDGEEEKGSEGSGGGDEDVEGEGGNASGDGDEDAVSTRMLTDVQEEDLDDKDDNHDEESPFTSRLPTSSKI